MGTAETQGKLWGQAPQDWAMWEPMLIPLHEEMLNVTKLQTNTDMGPGEIQKYCPVDDAGRGLLKTVMTQLHLSPRAYHRILKLARTIADLAGSARIEPPHLAEAIQYRPRSQI